MPTVHPQVQKARDLMRISPSEYCPGLRLDGGVRGKSVRTPSARHRHSRATGPGAHPALRDGRSGHAWRVAREYFLARTEAHEVSAIAPISSAAGRREQAT